MTKAALSKRMRLISSAARVLYRQGLNKTSLADIAQDAEVPLGNVYYYFKTKNELAEAVVDEYMSELRTIFADWDKLESPKDRLCAFITRTSENRERLSQSGCPIGTLCSELHKDGVTELGDRAAALFGELIRWLERQFKQIGGAPEAHANAVHLLSALQGVAVLAHSFHKPAMVVSESQRLKSWIKDL
jgi:AcrR family transcriptional regulator